MRDPVPAPRSGRLQGGVAALILACFAIGLAGCGSNGDDDDIRIPRAPDCAITLPVGGTIIDVASILNVTFTITAPDSTSLTYLLGFSTDGGTTFPLCTPVSGPNPIPGAPPGAFVFQWNLAADLGAATLPIQVQVGVGVDDDNSPFVGRCFNPTGPMGETTFTVDRLVAQPTCAINAPASGACADAVTGRLDLQLDITDITADPTDLTICFSTDGGGTFAPITVASASAGTLTPFAALNPDACVTGGIGQIQAVPVGALTVTWDILADGLTGANCLVVLVRVAPEDGSAATDFSSCQLLFSVTDN